MALGLKLITFSKSLLILSLVDALKIADLLVTELGIKKYRGLNSSDGGNTGDGVKIAGGVIGSGDEIEFSEELKELLPNEAGKESDETEV
ncbi:hypothetical protein Tco_1493690 [Tanacetum coccineum]